MSRHGHCQLTEEHHRPAPPPLAASPCPPPHRLHPQHHPPIPALPRSRALRSPWTINILVPPRLPGLIGEQWGEDGDMS